MCAVEPKSGKNQNPVRLASMPVYLLTFHVLERGLSGYTPFGNFPICHVAEGKRK